MTGLKIASTIKICMKKVTSPVKREYADRYFIFPCKFCCYRYNYPRVFGNGTLHIAHVLWGGLLLFIATIYPLIFANRFSPYRDALCLN